MNRLLIIIDLDLDYNDFEIIAIRKYPIKQNDFFADLMRFLNRWNFTYYDIVRFRVFDLYIQEFLENKKYEIQFSELIKLLKLKSFDLAEFIKGVDLSE